MQGERAKNYFMGHEGYKRLNCAQAIAQVFKDKFDFINENTIKEFKRMGHGKSPGGDCGMYFAARYILEKSRNEKIIPVFHRHFIGIAGTTLCAELKKKKIPFCAQCIAATAKFIEECITEDPSENS